MENLNEKKNRVKEENDYKLKIANDSVNKAQKAYEDFNDIYFVKYNKFIIKQKIPSLTIVNSSIAKPCILL